MRAVVFREGVVPPMLLLLSIAACLTSPAGERVSDEEKARARELAAVADRLRPLHEKMAPPRDGDWLSRHEEPGQTFGQYLKCGPTLPRGKRTVIYIQPLGDFTETQGRIVKLTAEFLGLHFGLSVRTQAPLSLKIIPASARRTHPDWGDRQIRSDYVLHKVLSPRLPEDAAAMIALTSSDLWPGRGWNFVFGQASLRGRVGVWSLHRNGDPDAGREEFLLCLLRTIKTAAHETGHMFSLKHCIAYECGMCGSNHREEADKRPVWLCPECLCKVVWGARLDPVERYRKLALFCKRVGLTKEARFYEKSMKTIYPEAGLEDRGP